ncbi:MAG: hypothetical protein JXR48_17610 [Candidatus Delongbacteria bacterium]|nr:hypothetical protein [Candidatus Delongbacteria bacterium]MBN2836775.1 hypothetical protein [Candidatus Delongbacteria bacterium]
MDVNIPKLKKNVEIYLSHGGDFRILECMIFLNKYSAIHKGEESVEEYLNSDICFIPVMDTQTNEFNILNKRHIICLKTEVEDEKGSLPRVNFDIHFDNGKIIKAGFLNDTLPKFRSRPLDYLNSGNNFIEFEMDEKITYFNTNHINRVTGL